MDNKNKRRRNRRRHHGVEEKASKTSIDFPKVWGVSSLWTPPLNHNELTILDGAVKEILSKTGLSDQQSQQLIRCLQKADQLGTLLRFDELLQSLLQAVVLLLTC